MPHSVSAANYGNYDDPTEIELYDRMLRETDFTRQRQLMRQFEKLVLDTEAHEIFLLWRYRIVPYRSYVKGWKVSPSHYVNRTWQQSGSTSRATVVRGRFPSPSQIAEQAARARERVERTCPRHLGGNPT